MPKRDNHSEPIKNYGECWEVNLWLSIGCFSTGLPMATYLGTVENYDAELGLVRIELCSLYSILVCKCFRFDNGGNAYFEPGRNKSLGKDEVLQWQWRKR